MNKARSATLQLKQMSSKTGDFHHVTEHRHDWLEIGSIMCVSKPTSLDVSGCPVLQYNYLYDTIYVVDEDGLRASSLWVNLLIG